MTASRNGFGIGGWLAAGAMAILMAASAAAEEKYYPIERDVSGGGDVTVDVPDRPIHRIDVLLRRLNPNDTDCHITVGLKGGDLFENGKRAQVDRQDLHELFFMGGDKWSKDRDVQVRVYNGSVHIKEIVVHFK